MGETYKFAEHYLREGTAPLDKITLGLLERIQQKYTIDYLSFLRTIEKDFPEGPTKTGLQNTEKKIQKVIRLLGTMRGVRGVRATRIEIEQLFALMQEVDNDLRSLQDLAEQVAEVREAITQAQAETDVTLEELALIHEQIHLTFKETRATRRGEIYEAVGGVARGLFWRGVYGLGGRGFAGLIGAGTRMYDLAKEAREKKAGHFLSEILAPTSRMRSGVEGGGVGGEDVFQGKPISWQPSKAKEDLRYAAAPIWYFFHDQAGKAKWTKEVLRLLKQNARVSGVLGGTGLVKDVKDTGKVVLGATVGATIAGAIKSALPKLLKGGLKIGIIGGLVAGNVYLWGKTISLTKTKLEERKKDISGLYGTAKYLRETSIDTKKEADKQRALGNIDEANRLDELAARGFKQAAETKLHAQQEEEKGAFVGTPYIKKALKAVLPAEGLKIPFMVPPPLPPEDMRAILEQLNKIKENTDKRTPEIGPTQQPISLQMREPYDSGDVLLQSYVSGRLATV